MGNRTDIKISKMPQNGYLLISFIDGVEFCKYETLAEVEEKMKLWKERTFLEVHAFNKEYEWRWIVSRRKGAIEAKIEDGQEEMKFEENVLVIPEFKHVLNKIKVINYMAYDENDMLYVKGYRLAPGEE